MILQIALGILLFCFIGGIVSWILERLIYGPYMTFGPYKSNSEPDEKE